MNMLPVGIFDGGRFFYLAVWGLTKNKKIGERAFKVSTWIFIILLVLMVFKWISGFF
jgi:membrane-associated protease RseP (regulator of RpoE activity)